MKLKQERKETIVMVAIVIAIVYFLLWITYPRNVEQPLPQPLDLDSFIQDISNTQNPEAAPAN